ncbi:MAG TPA: class I SAM-dependent methyltransferase [Anaerohalosphaeraceae bacterium]|nr:class I SAM-dependent methyltransferase [Anaerohalosphaeraceae bacterium]HOL30954.1 class I SAM-dependent methyltransferase [Anaerohalosphaeraceae bacterium]HOM75332.1 class I SAM-dependent methyltransferase [Anaerohalosphaeraceae bacterium]HPC63320.1 class I SAM-dependent methyltransferase [Anaerohalosphaeraceae bacterium]HPO68974.1 class I SAM-dependent methyltransferase [Anaerohalosphaeraceae bacterium]
MNYPPGHYYSPLPDISWVNAHQKILYPRDVKQAAGIELRTIEQQKLLKDLFVYFAEFDFPDDPSDKVRYYCHNPMYGKGGALILFGIIRRFGPKRIIEIGSGHTSALMLDINDRFMNRQIKLTFIEPCPDRLYGLLKDEDKAHCTVYETQAQNIPSSCFEQLQENDILFIDSSHVAKIGSDVNHIFFNILPVLNDGVIVHFHDIYWPFEYPIEWINEARAWNEAYLLRAFLQYNNRFDIILFNNYLARCFPEFYQECTGSVGGGSSIWIQKKTSR